MLLLTQMAWGNLKRGKMFLTFSANMKQSGNIFLLQETHWKTGAENVIRSQWGFECIVAGPDCASKGVAVLFENNFEYKIHNILKDDEGRYILIDIEMLNKRLTLANLYAPSSGDHPEFFDKVINEVVSMDNELIVIGGDWNVALNPKIDTMIVISHPVCIVLEVGKK